MRRALIAAASLTAWGCAGQDYIRSYSYDYTGKGRLAAEREATQAMQDACYLSGTQYFETQGPPRVVTEDTPAGEHVRVTQTYSCVGTQGGP